MLFYFLFIEGGVEPDMFGPFDTEQARDDQAKAVYSVKGDDHGYFSLDINNGVPEVSTYTRKELGG